jgi:hypothetical protein
VTLFEKNLPLLYDYDVFLVESNATFNEANCERVGIQKNWNLHQGSTYLASTYATKF